MPYVNMVKGKKGDRMALFSAENADLKARLERLERMIGAYALAVKAE
jgi:hypothetical protein